MNSEKIKNKINENLEKLFEKMLIEWHDLGESYSASTNTTINIEDSDLLDNFLDDYCTKKSTENVKLCYSTKENGGKIQVEFTFKK